MAAWAWAKAPYFPLAKGGCFLYKASLILLAGGFSIG
jgi:hypothetical protein